ncbi:hypothetical protein BDW66DRAFT_149164 [Aspergillus desertorum]
MPRLNRHQGPTDLALATTYKAPALDRACIPYVLWGWQALSFYACNEDFYSAEFVVLDEHVDAAAAAFVADGERQCINSNSRDRYQAVGHAHCRTVGQHITIAMHKKSDSLWWLDADFFVDNPAPDHPRLTLSTNPSLPDKKPLGPAGPWKEMYPVKIPNESLLIESVKSRETLYRW